MGLLTNAFAKRSALRLIVLTVTAGQTAHAAIDWIRARLQVQKVVDIEYWILKIILIINPIERASVAVIAVLHAQYAKWDDVRLVLLARWLYRTGAHRYAGEGDVRKTGPSRRDMVM